MDEAFDNTTRQLRILLVEDNPGDVGLVREALKTPDAARFELLTVERLEDARALVETQPFDAVLLDLTLPDSHGEETLVRLRIALQSVPIIVLTGVDDEALAVRLAQLGAQDYLVKGQLESRLLERSLRYAVERSRLLAELDQSRQREQQERELRSLDRLGSTPTSVTAQMFGLAPLRESTPNIFFEFVLQYENLLALALEQRAYKVEHGVSERLRFMAERIGFLNAGPRDVVEIHTTALKRKSREVADARAQVYIEEGRLMVLELMGYLVSFYRNYSLGTRRVTARDSHIGGGTKEETA